jgi:hypothetical protein
MNNKMETPHEHVFNVCKKKRLTFGISSWRKPTPERIKKVSGALATFLASISVASFFNDHETIAFTLLITQVALRELVIPLFGEREETIVTRKECEDINCEKVD